MKIRRPKRGKKTTMFLVAGVIVLGVLIPLWLFQMYFFFVDLEKQQLEEKPLSELEILFQETRKRFQETSSQMSFENWYLGEEVQIIEAPKEQKVQTSVMIKQEQEEFSISDSVIDN